MDFIKKLLSSIAGFLMKVGKFLDFRDKDDVTEAAERGEAPNVEKSKAKKRGFQSLFMGFGQIRNGQWYKGYPLMFVFFAFLIAEIATSTYIYAPAEIASNPAEDTLYFFRDYGGVFTRGIWGFFTLGAVTTYSVYRGQEIRARGGIYDWAAGDNSRALLGQGIIVLVLLAFLAGLWYFSVKDAYRTRLKIEAGIAVERFKDWIQRVWDEFFAYIIIIPAVALITLFTLIPFIFSFLVAFTNYTGRITLGTQLIQWHGFTTFANVFGGMEGWGTFFRRVFLWTVFYAIMSSFTVYVLGFIQAMVIESKYVIGKKVWRLIMILPWAVPGLISLMIFNNVFADSQGLMNQVLADLDITQDVKYILQRIGLVGQQAALPREELSGNILWFSHSGNAYLARAIIIMVNLWMGAPYFMLLITGVLGTIPFSLYEAADIDGASSFQKFRFVTFPWVVRATAPVIITTFTFNFNNFGAIYFLTGGGPGYPRAEIPQTLRGIAPGQTDILISWIYKLSFQSTVNHYNLAAVYSILIFLLIGTFAVWNLARLKSFWEED